MSNSNKRIRVLLLVKGLGMGGAESLLSMAIAHMDRDRFDYSVAYLLPHKDSLAGCFVRNGIQVSCLSRTGNFDPFALIGLYKLVRQRQIDVIHAHLPYSGLLARIVSRITNVKIVYTEHNLWSRYHPMMRWANRLTYGWNDQVIAVSEDVLRSISDIDKTRMSVIKNSVDIGRIETQASNATNIRQEFGISQTTFLVGNVANLSRKKNHELLIRAFSEFCASHEDSCLIIIGQYFGRHKLLKNLVCQLGIEEKVIFTGPRSDVISLMQSLDLFVMSSDFEGLPIALLEAMTLGKPVLCTSVGGIPEVIEDSVDGILVEPNDLQALAKKMSLLQTNPIVRDQLGKRAACKLRESFDMAPMVSKVEAIYKSLITFGSGSTN